MLNGVLSLQEMVAISADVEYKSALAEAHWSDVLHVIRKRKL